MNSSLQKPQQILEIHCCVLGNVNLNFILILFCKKKHVCLPMSTWTCVKTVNKLNPINVNNRILTFMFV